MLCKDIDLYKIEMLFKEPVKNNSNSTQAAFSLLLNMPDSNANTTIINCASIKSPDSAVRIIMGNIQETDDIYIKREVLQQEAMDEIGKAHNWYIGTFTWKIVSYRIFKDSFSHVQRYKRMFVSKHWEEAYIQFLKQNMASNAFNYNMLFPFVAGIKIFQGSIPHGTKLFLEQENNIPHIVESVSPNTYKVRPDYDDSEVFEIEKIQLEKIAIQTWQMDNRKIYPEFFEE